MQDEIIYTAQKTGLEKGRKYQNPRFFDGKVRKNQKGEPYKRCIVVGNWPQVVAAYEKAGIPVEKVSVTPPSGARPMDAPKKIEPAPEKDAEIPENFEELSWPELRKLAASISDRKCVNKAECIETIKDELMRRAGINEDE